MRLQPTPQKAQIVSVSVWRDSSHSPASRSSYSETGISAPVGQTPMQLPQYTQADSGSGLAYSVEMWASKPAPGDGDRERVLVLLTACVDALVTEHALGVVAHVELVVELRQSGHGGRGLTIRDGVTTGLLVAPLRVGRRRRPVALGRRLVALEVDLDTGRGREIDRGGQQLEDHAAIEAHPLGVGLHLHPVLGAARAGGHEGARPRELDHAHPAGVGRCERLAVTQRRGVDAHALAGVAAASRPRARSPPVRRWSP